MRKNSALLRLFKYIKPYTLFFVASLLLSILYVVSSLLIPYFFGKAIDNLLSKDIITNLFINIGVLIGIAAASLYLMTLSNNHLAFSLTKDMRKDTFNKIHRLPLSYLDTHSMGDIVSRMVNDIDTLSDGLLLGLNQLFTGVVTIIITLVIMLYMNWFMASVVLVLTPLSLFFARFVAKRIHKYFHEQSVVKGEQTSFIEEAVPYQTVIRAFDKQEDSQIKFEEVSSRLEKASIKSLFFSSLVNPTTRFVNYLVYAVIILIGSFVVIGIIDIGGSASSLTVGALTTFLAYAREYSKPFNDISSVITELQNALVCANRVFDLLDSLEEESFGEEKQLENVQGNVSFENVSFSYTPNQKLIENINIKITKGMKVAIVGPTGCGKTTLINLLMRFYDVNSGNISIDTNSLKTLKRSSIHENFGMVLQDTWIRHGSVKDNITMGLDIPMEEIIEASKKTHAHSFIMKMKDGYDTILDENGGNLSAGQKQLICITRVMVNIPPMLILDEATSSIDTRTEVKIQDAFDTMMNGRTSFLVAHRLSTIRQADLILVMKDGNIIEQGNHDQLIEKKGFYYELYNSQFAHN